MYSEYLVLAADTIQFGTIFWKLHTFFSAKWKTILCTQYTWWSTICLLLLFITRVKKSARNLAIIAELDFAQIWQATQIFEPVSTLNALMSVKKSLPYGKMQTSPNYQMREAVSDARLRRYLRQFSTDLILYKFIVFIIETWTSKIHQVKMVVP